jgi:hypothetical protein
MELDPYFTPLFNKLDYSPSYLFTHLEWILSSVLVTTHISHCIHLLTYIQSFEVLVGAWARVYVVYYDIYVQFPNVELTWNCNFVID